MEAPEKIEIIGEFLALRWRNGKELFIDSPTLRANSPSEQAGERIFCKISGSEFKEFCGVTIKKFEYVENYVIRLLFSDGHGSGIYS